MKMSPMSLQSLEMSLGSTDGKARAWAETVVQEIHTQLSDKAHPLTQELSPCGQELLEMLDQASDPSAAPSRARSILGMLEIASEDKVKVESAASRSVSLHVRRLYSDCRLLRALVDLRDPGAHNGTPELTTMWESTITRLDMAIIIAGAPGEGRLDLILDTIEIIQAEFLPLKEDHGLPHLTRPLSLTEKLPDHSFAPNSIPRITPPSVTGFRSASCSPFVLPGFIEDWPAFQNHPWSSPAYLRHVAGRGRVVPVEIGSDYRADEWSQKMLPWDAFLRGIGMEDEGEDSNHTDMSEILYLAQHNLLTQFPALRADVIIPDYVYSSPSPPSTYPSYRPPGNEEQLVINAWLGPAGTVSPAHTDPYFNCYAQVVGRKTVWLAASHFQQEMYPFPNMIAPHTSRTSPASQFEELPPPPSLGNTSRVDVFSSPASTSDADFPLFESLVRPNAYCTVLHPGDMLYIPPGWWHAMRSEDVSFSVSMWF